MSNPLPLSHTACFFCKDMGEVHSTGKLLTGAAKMNTALLSPRASRFPDQTQCPGHQASVSNTTDHVAYKRNLFLKVLEARSPTS